MANASASLGDAAFLTDGGEMGALVRAHDWAGSPIGPPQNWPHPLRTLVGVILAANQPMFVAWGPDRTLLYNDAYAEILANKHPAALGRDVLEVWHEIRADLVPIVDGAYAGRPVHMDDIELRMERRGYSEETHFAFSYTPVRDEAGEVGGFLCACVEITEQVLSERRRTFRLALEERLRNLDDPKEIMAAALALISGHLGLDRVGYTEVVGDRTVRMTASFVANGMVPLTGEFPLESFGEERIARQRQGITEVCDDVQSDPEQDDDVWAAIDTRAFLSVPLVREGRLRASLYVNNRTSRRWTPEEVALVEQVAARTWDAVERARSEAALRESEARFRLMANASPQILWITDAQGRTEFFNKQWTSYVGVPDIPPTAGDVAESYVHPDDQAATMEAFAEALRTGTTFHVEHRIRSAAGDYRWFLVRGEPYRDQERGEIVRWFGASVDIHDRRQAEAELRASEERLSFLDRLNSETAALADADAVLATTTRLLGEHLGLSLCAYADMDEDEDGFTIRGDWAAPGSRSIVGRYRLADFGHLAVANLGAGQPLVVHDNRRELAPEEAATFQNLGIAATICMPLVKEGRLAALMAIHDRVPRVWREEELALLREVTERSWAYIERVGALAGLRESEARFQAIANSIDQMVWSARPDGFHDFYNQRWYDYTGVPEGSTDGGAWNDVFHRDDQEGAWAAWRHSLETGEPYRIEYRLRHRSGRYRWVLGRAQAVKDSAGRITRWYGTCTDIQDIVEAREVLTRSRAELEQRVAEALADRNRLWTLSEDMLARADYSGMMSAVSPAWTRVLGWSETELLTRPYSSFMHPEDTEVTLAALARTGETGQPTRFENRIATKDGSWKPIEWTVAPEPDSPNFIAVGRDLTEVKAREEELRQAQEALRQSQKMEAMGQLTGGVAHDFNNLLTPIIGSLDRLLRRGVGSEREQRLMDGALQSAERAKVLVQRLLAFARRQPLQPGPVDVRDLVGDMADLVASTTGPRIDVRVQMPEDLPPALADANQLEMAVLNLAVNARDAMPEGGRLTISAARESVRGHHPARLRPGHYVRLSVTDTGTGMDEATLARAVEPFFSTKGIGKGTGLGLSMVHGLVSQLNGGLTITSSLGQGTTVHLWLPISTVAVEEDGHALGAAKAPQAQGTALLVDDEDLVRMSTADMLMDLGYEVVEAQSADEALRLVGEGLAPDLVVTDHLMPGLSGVDLARDLRSRRPDLPVLIVSGYAEMDGIAPGFPRLTKPFRSAELAASLAALVPTGAEAS